MRLRVIPVPVLVAIRVDMVLRLALKFMMHRSLGTPAPTSASMTASVISFCPHNTAHVFSPLTFSIPSSSASCTYVGGPPTRDCNGTETPRFPGSPNFVGEGGVRRATPCRRRG